MRVYAANPSLTGTRAGLRAIDEDADIARAQGRPDLAATADYVEYLKRSVNSFTAPQRSLAGTVTLSAPIYAGGQIRNAIKAADARVDAGRSQLRSAEADIFSETVAAYMDVIRDEAIVELNGSNVRVLDANLNASRDRFRVGDLTRTDVAQSDARLALARSQLELARTQLLASRENYLRVVGKFPERLEPPPPLPPFPDDPDDAVEVAVKNNPALASARGQSVAARYDIGVERSLRLPRINAFVSGNYTNYLGTLGDAISSRQFAQRDKTATAGLRASLPLFRAVSRARGCARRRRAAASRWSR